MSGSVHLYKGLGSYRQGKARVNSLDPYREHVYSLLWSPITSTLCSKEDPTQASQQPGCSFITYSKTQTTPDWLQLISLRVRTVVLHCFQVWSYCVVKSPVNLDHKQPCVNAHTVKLLAYTTYNINWYPNQCHSKICMIALKQTRVSPLSLLYLLLQIQGHVNRLQSIRQELNFHNRVGVKNILQQPCADCQNKSYWKREQRLAWEDLAGYVVTQKMGDRNSWHSC